MNLIDIRTAILLIGVLSGLMSVVLYALRRSYPASIGGLGEWSTGLLLIFLGGLLAAGRRLLPEFFTTAAPNFILMTGVYVLYVGTQRFFGVRPRPWPWMAFISCVVLATMWFTWVEPLYVVRLRLVATAMVAMFAAQTWLIWQQGLSTFARVLAFTMVVLIMVMQVVRVLTSFALPVGVDILDGTPEQALYIASFSFSLLLFAISTVLLASERLRIELEYLATHDSLTNALTRRHLTDACQRELERCNRQGLSMAVLLLDLDHFKQVNDTHGHQTGDRVLIQFVARVRASLRSIDLLGRFGGEEFVVLLPNTRLPEAQLVAERIRQACDQAEPAPTVTVSIGLSTNQGDGDTLDALLGRADAALYRAKAQGRNRVEVG